MSDSVGAGPDSGGGTPPMPPAAGGPPGGGPPAMAGSPILAALARSRGAMQPSAPGQGTMANSLMQIKSALDMLQGALPGLGMGGDIHSAVLSAIRSLSRHIPQGAPVAGVQQTQLQDMLRNTLRNALLQKVMQQQGGQSPTPPSTPMPGA